MEILNWRDKPICATRWSNDATHILYVDENGHSSLKNIIKCFEKRIDINENEKYFNICSTLISRNDHLDIALSLTEIKHKFWVDGQYAYEDGLKSVCFHSEEIRKQKGPFSKKQINQESFFNDLNFAMKKMEMTIFDCFIDKEKYYKSYYDKAKEPYSIGIQYILERVVNKIDDSDKVMIVCESRANKEDRIVLETIKLLMINGTYYVSDKKFKKITGIYFNPKRSTDCSKSYIGLEIADLCAYPIFKYGKHQVKDDSFLIIETKIHGYPFYLGKGLKYVP